MKTQAEIERGLMVLRSALPDILCVDHPDTENMAGGLMCMIKVLEWVIDEETDKASVGKLIDELEGADKEAGNDSIN